MNRWGLLLGVLAGALFAQSIPSSAGIETGRKLFQEACSACHGQTGGGGHGPGLVNSRRVRDMDAAKIFEVIQNGVKGTAMPASSLPSGQIRSIATFVRGLNAAAIDSTLPGDANAGKALYLGKGGCVRCHAIAGEGGWLGPDLSNAGVWKTAFQLKESIIDPDRRIAEDYRGATVATQDGQIITGVVRNFDNYSVQLIDATGKLHRFARASLAKFEIQDHSLMPRDYAKRLSSAEVDNLVAWLARQSVRPREK